MREEVMVKKGYFLNKIQHLPNHELILDLVSISQSTFIPHTFRRIGSKISSFRIISYREAHRHAYPIKFINPCTQHLIYTNC